MQQKNQVKTKAKKTNNTKNRRSKIKIKNVDGLHAVEQNRHKPLSTKHDAASLRGQPPRTVCTVTYITSHERWDH